VDSVQFEPQPAKKLALAISIGAAIFPHDGDSYETLLATADSRMYRDKARRKRQAPSATASDDRPPQWVSPASPWDVVLRRAAGGVL
jgi:GGDEF domain-containing protein